MGRLIYFVICLPVLSYRPYCRFCHKLLSYRGTGSIWFYQTMAYSPRKELDLMKASSRFLSAFLVLALMLSCSAFASGTGTTAVTAVEEKAGQEGTGQEGTGEEGSGEELSAGVDSTTELFLSLTEGTSKSLAFPLTEEQAALAEKAGADKVICPTRRRRSTSRRSDSMMRTNMVSLFPWSALRLHWTVPH